jgi:hypothetical protein
MCFMLYAGTNKPLPRKKWDRDAPDLCVKSLDKSDADMASHFTQREVQNIGSTSGCGCDFPHITLTRGEWVGYSDVVVDDLEWEASERFNREALVRLLRESREEVVELYGIWLSDGGDVSSPENFRDEIPLKRILEPTFRFKERGFYQVTCGQVSE